jgi:hypothetical protein
VEWAVGALAVLVLLLVELYRRALREIGLLANFALLVLLDGNAYAVQRQGLVDSVRSIDARNALELGARVNASLSNLAARLDATKLGIAGLLWKLKNELRAP